MSGITKRLIENASVSTYNIVAIGVIGSIGHPLYWLWWTYIDPQPYENWVLRLIGTLSCFLLLIHSYWPSFLKKLLPWFWFLTASYNFPFFFIYYLIASGYSQIWSIAVIEMILMIVIVLPNLVLLFLSLFLGTGSAILLAYLNIPNSLTIDKHLFLFVYFPTFSFCILTGIIFSRGILKGLLAQERTNAFRTLAGSIAHEMRSPLTKAHMSLQAIRKIVSELGSNTIPSGEFQKLQAITEAGSNSIYQGNQVIDLILGSLQYEKIDNRKFEYLSAAKTTQKAVYEYGYPEMTGSTELRDRVSVNVVQDFIFYGDKTAYTFVLFNLIKNAAYYFQAKPDATISITVNGNKVAVRDTGVGIPKTKLETLFDSFMTSGKKEGTGLGLPYCKRIMQSFGGDIVCESVLDEFTEFTLSFPRVDEATKTSGLALKD